MDETLTRFIRDALAKNVAKSEIRAALLDARWPEDQVKSAVDSFADIDFPIPVPRPKPYLSARETFVYLVLFTLLYLSAWGVGAVLFQLINNALPDPAQQASWRSFSIETLRWALASLLIGFPGFFFLSRRSYTAARRDPEKRQSKVRKWLTYLTLFLAAGTLLGDLISLVYNLLEGELTMRFLLKVLVVGGIAGSVLGYYLWDLRQDDLEPGKASEKHAGLRVFAVLIMLGVVATLIPGLFLAGSPGRARMAQLDQVRRSELQEIASVIDFYWREHEALPSKLATLETDRRFPVGSVRDPETGEPYTYRVTGERSYELCAVFDTVFDRHATPRLRDSQYGSAGRFWNHGAGATCFEIEAPEPDA